VNKKLINNLLLVVIFIFVLVATGITLFNTGIITTKFPDRIIETINVTLVIDYGDDNFETFNFETSNLTVFSVLKHASEKYKFPIEVKYFGQYQSHYVYSINNKSEGIDNKFWQYYINENYGTIGADLQPVNDNDYIEWKFQEPKI